MNPSALHKLSYGIYILTAEENGIPYGCIINTAFQITSKPARIAVSCSLDNYTHGKILSSGSFGISVLTENADPALIGTFGYKSGRDIDKFSGFSWVKGSETGVPLFTAQSAAAFECRVIDRVDVGTHTIFIGDVLFAELAADHSPEMTYRNYHEIRKGSAPKNAPTYIENTPVHAKEIWVCDLCGYEYGSETELSFENLPHDWICPICGADKSMFSKK